MNQADQFVKRRLRCCQSSGLDDMLLFADDKRTLWTWRDHLLGVLAGLRLTAHEASAIPRPTAAGTSFRGFQVSPTRRRLKRRNAVTARRLADLCVAHAALNVTADRVTGAVRGWVNHARCGDAWRLRRVALGGVVLGGGKGHSILPPVVEDRVGR